MTLSLKEDVNICFFNNENTSHRKNCIPYFISKVTLTDGHSSVENDQFYLSDF